MSMTLLSILVSILFAQLVTVLVFYQNSVEQIKGMQYSLGAEMRSAEHKIEGLKAAIMDLHERIDESAIELAELENRTDGNGSHQS